jgi:quercetin dioxygenase-like cupin family protein
MTNTSADAAARLPNACVPYVLAPGQGPAYLVAGQMIRMLATTAETNGAFGVVLCLSPQDQAAIPLHWHAREHDTWYCTHGKIQVWNGSASRVLHPGDFAYVKPTETHSYQCRGTHNAFFGVVAPGGWEAFFADAGEAWPYDAYPPAGTHRIDFARLGAAMGKHGVNRVDQQVYAEATSGRDVALPGTTESYFLEAGYGTRSLLPGLLATTIISAAETGGTLSMQVFAALPGASLPPHQLQLTHELLHVLDGSVTLLLDETEHHLAAGATANIPAGTRQALRAGASGARWISATAGDDMPAFFAKAGQPTELFHPPHESPAASGRLEEAGAEYGVIFD